MQDVFKPAQVILAAPDCGRVMHMAGQKQASPLAEGEASSGEQ